MKNAISVKYTLLCGTACCMASAVQAQRNVSDVSRMNVLFLMADDMRPELGCYGVEAVKTPNMDRLASSGVLFQNAYCNVPVSGASRASLLTGVYPHYPDRFVNFSAYASKDCPEAIPLSGWFTKNGYHTVSDGKVFHHMSDHAASWSEPPYRNHQARRSIPRLCADRFASQRMFRIRHTMTENWRNVPFATCGV